MTHVHYRGCLQFSFVELRKPAIYIFFQHLHLLSFPTIYSLPCFSLKWRAYEFFFRGHLRRSGVAFRTVPPFVTAHTFCASRDIKVSWNLPTNTKIFLRSL